MRPSHLCCSLTIGDMGLGPCPGRGAALRARTTWLRGLEGTVTIYLWVSLHPAGLNSPAALPVSCLPFAPRWCLLQPGYCWRCSQGSFLGLQTASACRSRTRISKTTWCSSSRSSITFGSHSSGCSPWPRSLLWQALMLARGPGPCTQLACNNEATEWLTWTAAALHTGTAMEWSQQALLAAGLCSESSGSRVRTWKRGLRSCSP